jgi:hypothetical protein
MTSHTSIKVLQVQSNKVSPWEYSAFFLRLILYFYLKYFTSKFSLKLQNQIILLFPFYQPSNLRISDPYESLHFYGGSSNPAEFALYIVVPIFRQIFQIYPATTLLSPLEQTLCKYQSLFSLDSGMSNNILQYYYALN